MPERYIKPGRKGYHIRGRILTTPMLGSLDHDRRISSLAAVCDALLYR
jgi:hypothetical protein